MLNKAISATLLFLFFAYFNSSGQDRLPPSFALRPLEAEDIPVKVLPPIPLGGQPAKSLESGRKSFLKMLEFGTTLSANINFSHECRRDTVKGRVIERLAIKSMGAKSLGIRVIPSDNFSVDGSNIYLYTPNRSFVANMLTRITGGAQLSLPIIPGDCAVLEVVHEQGNAGSLTVAEVVHGEVLPLRDSWTSKILSQGCNVDVACPAAAGWQNEKNGVVRLEIGTDYGTRLCTGVLINNSARNMKPYILTANHCIKTQAEAQKTVAYFGYERVQCGSGTVTQGQSISGATLRATGYNSQLDFTLIELSTSIPQSFNPYWAGWDIRKKPFDKAGATSIHHPQGDVKKISLDYDFPIVGDYTKEQDPTLYFDANSHWRILKWDVGTTEGGSSGSPLFNMNHQVVGSLTGGLASCSNSIDDYFSMINPAWSNYPSNSNSLKSWLDPIALGDSTCTGMHYNQTKYTIYASKTSPCSGDTVTVFVEPADANLVLKNIQAANAQEISGGTSSKLIWTLEPGAPSKDIIANLVLNGNTIGSAFVVSVKSAPSKPSISLMDTTLFTTATDQLRWYYNGTALNSTSQALPVQGAGLYYVKASNSFGCASTSNTIIVNLFSTINPADVVVYPVPVTSDIIHIKILDPKKDGSTVSLFKGECMVTLYDLLGRKLSRKSYSNTEGIIDFSIGNASAGMYILEITSAGQRVAKKIVVATNR